MTCPCDPKDHCETCCEYPCCQPWRLQAEALEDRPDLDPNSTVDDRLRRLDLSCSFCPPNRMENGRVGHKRNAGQKSKKRRGQ